MSDSSSSSPDPSISRLLAALSSEGLLPEQDFRRISELSDSDETLKSLAAVADDLVNSRRLTKFVADRLREGAGDALVLDNYVLLEKVGHGGMGEVYRAYHMIMKKDVAVKLMLPPSTQHLESVKRFKREIRLAADLTHANLICARDAGQAHGHYYLVMDFVRGRDLSRLVRKQGSLDVAKALDYVIQAAQGLEYAHKRGIIHRDVKPSNLLLGDDGVVKVLDLGLSRLQPELRKFIDGDRTEETFSESSTTMGTINYMAPEQALAPGSVDQRADIYSLGCTLHFLLTGLAPFPRGNDAQRLIAHREESPPSLNRGSLDVPKLLEETYLKMMAKEPQDRQSSMTELLKELRRVQHHLESIDGQSTRGFSVPDDSAAAVTRLSPESRRRLRNRWIASTAVVLLAGLTLWFLRGTPDGRTATSIRPLTSVGTLPPVGSSAATDDAPAALPTMPVNLLKDLDLTKVSSRCPGWQLVDETLHVPAAGRAENCWLILPPLAPQHYQLTMNVVRTSGTGGLLLGIPLENDNATVLIIDRGTGIRGRHESTINAGPDGRATERIYAREDAPTHFPEQHTRAVEVRVDALGLHASIDGETVLKWTDSLDLLQQGDGWTSHPRDQIFIGSHNKTAFDISDVWLIPLNGKEQAESQASG